MKVCYYADNKYLGFKTNAALQDGQGNHLFPALTAGCKTLSIQLQKYILQTQSIPTWVQNGLFCLEVSLFHSQYEEFYLNILFLTPANVCSSRHNYRNALREGCFTAKFNAP